MVLKFHLNDCALFKSYLDFLYLNNIIQDKINSCLKIIRKFVFVLSICIVAKYKSNIVRLILIPVIEFKKLYLNSFFYKINNN